jgi:hypothetical protein
LLWTTSDAPINHFSWFHQCQAGLTSSLDKSQKCTAPWCEASIGISLVDASVVRRQTQSRNVIHLVWPSWVMMNRVEARLSRCYYPRKTIRWKHTRYSNLSLAANVLPIVMCHPAIGKFVLHLSIIIRVTTKTRYFQGALFMQLLQKRANTNRRPLDPR